jgi:hypothetical protein
MVTSLPVLFPCIPKQAFLVPLLTKKIIKQNIHLWEITIYPLPAI